MTHHVTSYVLALTLVLVAVASLFTKDRRSAALSGALALWAIIVAVGWLVFRAPQTVSYLSQPLAGVWDSFRALLGDGGTATPSPIIEKPVSHEIIAGGAVLLLSCLLPVGWLQVKKHFHGQTWMLALSLGSLTWYAIIVIRLGAADGSELFGRAASFVYVPSAFIAALALRWVIDRVPRLRATAFLSASLAGVLLLSVDGILNGWPPSWERLPGPHQVERSRKVNRTRGDSRR